MAPLTNAQVLTLLEKAQTLPPTEALSTIASLPQRIKPNPSLTEPLLDLLQIHPHEALPHIADLLPATATQELLEVLSTLLSSDRQLLPPILGILPSLPLTPSQALETRATIAYALDVVDRDDIPTVVRTLSTMRSTWAADTLRSRIRLTPDIAPVVAETLSDVLTPKNHLAERLLSPQPPPRPLDFLLLVQALESRLARLARRSIKSLAQSGAFSRCSYGRTIASLATILPSHEHGVARLLSTLLSAARAEAGEIAAVAKFCKSVIEVCPSAALGISAARGFVATNVHMFLLSSIDNVRLKPSGLHRVPEITVHALQCTEPQNWAPLFISVRKGALFGSSEDYVRVEGLSRCVVEHANEEIIRELFELLDSCVGKSLSEPLAVVVLNLLGDALMRGVFLKDIFRKRIAKLPDGLLRRIKEDEKEIIQVDIGLVWQQPACTIASVVSSAVAMILVDRGTEGIARGLLDVSVLVPVVCISLYQAVEDLQEPISLSPKRKQRSQVVHAIPDQVSELESSDLSTAVLAFGTGMAAIVGLLNRSSKFLEISERVLERRHRDDFENEDRTARWMVLDRLTEFFRMRTALALAMDVLQQQWEDLRTPHKDTDTGKRRKREKLRQGLERSQMVRDSILFSVQGQETTKQRGRERKDYTFPSFSIEAVVLSLVSIPDEEGIETICDETKCKLTRDIELVRLDKLLLSQLLRLMTSSITGFGSARDGQEDVGAFSKERNTKAADWVARNYFNMKSPSTSNITEIMPDFEEQLEQKDNIFFDDKDFSDDEAMEEPEEKSTVLWAPSDNSGISERMFVQSTVSLLLQKRPSTSGRRSQSVASLVHSPAFAALLLDRAATYIGVARRARKLGSDEEFLSELVMASGLTLGCLNKILRVISELPSSEKTTNSDPSVGETEKSVCEFLNLAGERLIVNVPLCSDAVKNPLIISKHLNSEGWKMISTLRWIANTSVEAAVASVAVDGLLTLSEYDVCLKSYARQLAFSSLSTVYEYEGGALWEQHELDMVLRDSFSEWSMRRRRSQERTEAHLDQVDAPDPHPWIDLKFKRANRKLLERQRLSNYFSGMFVPDALIEGCGWVREIFVALCAASEMRNVERTVESSKSHIRERAIAHRKSAKRQRAEPQELVRKEVLTCDTLFDMIGFRTIIELLLDLVIQGLRAYPVSASLSADDSNDMWTSPIPHLRSTLRLFSGLVSLYHENRRRLISASRNAPNQSIFLDPDFDYSMVTAYVAVLQTASSRIDELLAWYSNPSTIVSQLSMATMKLLEELVGTVALAVNMCSEVAESIKADQGLDETDGVNTSASEIKRRRMRKTPGYEKRPRKQSTKEELSKARRLMPRLSGQGENVVKRLQRLAKTIGIRARQNLSRLASQPIACDSSLHFGIGLEQGADDREDGNPMEQKHSDAGKSKTTAGMSPENSAANVSAEIEGFHALSVKTDKHAALQETVTVNFGTSDR